MGLNKTDMTTDEKKLAIAAIIQNAHMDIINVINHPTSKPDGISEGGVMIAGVNDDAEFIAAPSNLSSRTASHIGASHMYIDGKMVLVDGREYKIKYNTLNNFVSIVG